MTNNYDVNERFYPREIKMDTLPNESEVDFLLKRNKNYMNNVALTFDKKKITYEEMHTRIDEYARALYKRGVREGDLIAIGVVNTPEAIYLSYALQKLGAITVSLNPIESRKNLIQDLNVLTPKMYIGINEGYNNFRYASRGRNIDTIIFPAVQSIDSKLVKMLYSMKNILTGNQVYSMDKKLSKMLKDGKDFEDVIFPEYKEGATSEIMFTGGSSGTHKGVELTGNGFNSVVQSLDYLNPLSPGDTFMGNIPEFFAFGKLALHYALCNNTNVHLTLNAMPKDFSKELYRIEANGVFAGPIQWEYFINDIFAKAKSGIGKIDFSLINIEDEKAYLEFLKRELETIPKEDLWLDWLKMGVSGGEQLRIFTEKVCNLIFEYLGAPDVLWNGLGMTEMSAPVAVKKGKINTIGTVGPMIPYNEARIVDPITHEVLPKGSIGLLCVRGPGMMNRYYNNEEETQSSFIEIEGKKYLNSKDIVRENELGELEYIDRLKRSFVCGIENVYPQRIENVVSKFPEVEESIVTRIRDNEMQNVPKLHIFLRDKDCDVKKLEERINKEIIKELSTNYAARYFEYHEERLPRTAGGKLDPKPLQESDNTKYLHRGKVLKRN